VSCVKTELLHCIHPTVKADTATVESDKATVTEGDTCTTRVRVFYAGLVKQHTMVLQGMDHAGQPPWVRAQLLEETQTGHVLRRTETTADGQELKE
jgi:hypothetical protein